MAMLLRERNFQLPCNLTGTRSCRHLSLTEMSLLGVWLVVTFWELQQPIGNEEIGNNTLARIVHQRNKEITIRFSCLYRHDQETVGLERKSFPPILRYAYHRGPLSLLSNLVSLIMWKILLYSNLNAVSPCPEKSGEFYNFSLFSYIF